MASFEAGLVSLNQIPELIKQINTELIERPVQTESLINQFCWRRPGGGAVGETVKFIRRLWANQVEDRNPYEEIPGRKPVVAEFEVTHREKAPDAEVIPRWTKITDLYGILKDEICPEMLARIESQYAMEIATLIGNGTTKKTIFDNQNFFVDTELHEAAPGRADSKKYKNWKRLNKLDTLGISAGIQLLETQPSADGNYVDMPGEVLCVCSTFDQFRRAQAVYAGELVAEPVGAAAAAAVSNVLIGRARPVWFKQLGKFYTGASGITGDGWLLVKSNGKFSPFTLSFADEGTPQIYLEGFNPNDHNRVTRNLLRVGYRGGWGTGTLFPDLAVLSTETT